MSAFDGLKVEELDAELEKRGLPVEGHKQDKISALEAFDAQQNSGDGGNPGDGRGDEAEDDLYGGYKPTREEKKAGGRLVKKATIIDDQYGRGHLYDVDDFMPFEIIKDRKVGEHIFSDEATPGDQAGLSVT